MYDELVKRLYECVSGECWNCSQKADDYEGQRTCAAKLMKQAADAIEELQRICETMKPKYETVCVKCKYYYEANFNDKGFLICPACGMDITAWDFCSYFEKAEEDEK